jgi:hypothetical protein
MNPHLCVANVKKTNPRPSWVRHRGTMNATESEFALYLEALKRSGEILRYEFEGMTLRWADMRYTPDFVVFEPITTEFKWKPGVWPVKVKLIEVKGAHIWSRDLVRFKGARAYWPEFQFEMHQKTKSGWKRKF